MQQKLLREPIVRFARHLTDKIIGAAIMIQRIYVTLIVVAALLLNSNLLFAQADKPDDKPKPLAKKTEQKVPPPPYDLGGQATFSLQQLFPFHSPYSGPNSLPSRSELELTHTYTLFLGAKFGSNVEMYINPEVALGNGLNGGTGLAAYTNGEVIGQGSVPTDPYFARYFVRWRIPVRSKGEPVSEERIARSQNIMTGTIPSNRLVVSAGKFAVSDYFDANAYANSARTQFMNKGLSNNLAYDFAQDLRGYSNGASVSWITPDWALRVGSFMMPDVAGSRKFAGDIWNNRGDQVEYDRNIRVLPGKKPPATLRGLLYRNVGNMGGYREAIAAAQGTGNAPDVTSVRKRGRAKFGAGLNFDQALADGGATGVFGRWGWNDGASESFCFAEADRTWSLGGQLSGSYWNRKDDRVGLALLQSGLSNAHRDYLAAGGAGISVGDGKLNYGAETVLETYYAYQLSKPVTLSFDYQLVNNPGYNRDRGPVSVLGFRVHGEF
jgi:high affinity Mn2+ porin